MRRIYGLILLFFCVTLFGCQKSKYDDVTEDTIFVTKSNKVTAVTFNELSNYGSLNTFNIIDDNRMIEYNYSVDDISVSRVESVQKGDYIRLVTRYNNFLAYEGYIGVKFFAGSLEEACIGFDFNEYKGKFLEYSSGQSIAAQTVMDKKDMYAVIINQEMLIDVSGKIKYYSDNVELIDESHARAPSDGLCYIIFK